MSTPNILFIMADQLRRDALGCTGARFNTPNLDRIAAEGVCFTHCVTNSPVCIPARVTLATGLYPHNTGVWDNCRYDLPPDTPTWMQAIRAVGYRTSLFGKTHLHHHGGDLRDREPLMHAYGLDDVDEIGGPRASARLLSHMTAEWERKGLWESYREDYRDRFDTKPHVARASVLPLEDYADVYVGRRAREYLASYTRSEPWFCWVSFGGPHEPWDAPEPYASMYDPASMPAPVPALESRAAQRPTGLLDERLRQRPDPSRADIAAMRANYAGNVTLIDDQVGGILDVIEERGELDNTVIVVSSDHGEMNGDCGLIYKNVFLDGAVRVPLLVRTPRTLRSARAGSVSEGPVEWMDIGPTLVELAGGHLVHQHFARSLVSVLRGRAEACREFAVSELHGEIMILDATWKAAVNARGEVYLLFDRVHDPLETTNLAGSSAVAHIETQCRLRLFEHLVQTAPQSLAYRPVEHEVTDLQLDRPFPI